mmetsp:Transcript_31065/g.61239  ORF Transcript_31065/g.61239 Transcript_31065/m.61239 type:complete len:265 (-) Transcript_31065:147-941(-)
MRSSHPLCSSWRQRGWSHPCSLSPLSVCLCPSKVPVLTCSSIFSFIYLFIHLFIHLFIYALSPPSSPSLLPSSFSPPPPPPLPAPFSSSEPKRPASPGNSSLPGTHRTAQPPRGARSAPESGLFQRILLLGILVFRFPHPRLRTPSQSGVREVSHVRSPSSSSSPSFLSLPQSLAPHSGHENGKSKNPEKRGSVSPNTVLSSPSPSPAERQPTRRTGDCGSWRKQTLRRWCSEGSTRWNEQIRSSPLAPSSTLAHTAAAAAALR